MYNMYRKISAQKRRWMDIEYQKTLPDESIPRPSGIRDYEYRF